MFLFYDDTYSLSDASVFIMKGNFVYPWTYNFIAAYLDGHFLQTI